MHLLGLMTSVHCVQIPARQLLGGESDIFVQMPAGGIISVSVNSDATVLDVIDTINQQAITQMAGGQSVCSIRFGGERMRKVAALLG